MNERQFLFEWDDANASANLRKHNVSFDTARTVFYDSQLLTIADVELSKVEDRWFSVGSLGSGAILSVVYVWQEVDPFTVNIRIISARKATQAEIRQYHENP